MTSKNILSKSIIPDVKNINNLIYAIVERSDSRDEEISSDIKKLTQMFVDKEIDDMRWEINNFATNVSEGKPCNKDSFTHCIHIFEKYEKILEENGLENGEVELSMELINDAYKKKMTEGFI